MIQPPDNPVPDVMEFDEFYDKYIAPAMKKMFDDAEKEAMEEGRIYDSTVAR